MQAIALAALTLLFLLATNASAGVFNIRPTVAAVENDLDQGQIPERINLALSAMFRLASRELERRGHNDEAFELVDEYQRIYAPYVLYGAYAKDIGDHEPLSQWLADKYQQLLDLLGPTVMVMLHLDDIWIVNYAIPVVLLRVPEFISKDEYRLHFAGSVSHGGLAGVITYWSIFFGCEFATAGSGWIFICTPAGAAGEHIMQHRIAPGLSDRIYDRITQNLE